MTSAKETINLGVPLTANPPKLMYSRVYDHEFNLPGFSIEVMQLIGHIMNVTFNVSYADGYGSTCNDTKITLVRMLCNRDIDFTIPSMAITESRSRSITFSQPILKTSRYLLGCNTFHTQQKLDLTKIFDPMTIIFSTVAVISFYIYERVCWNRIYERPQTVVIPTIYGIVFLAVFILFSAFRGAILETFVKSLNDHSFRTTEKLATALNTKETIIIVNEENNINKLFSLLPELKMHGVKRESFVVKHVDKIVEELLTNPDHVWFGQATQLAYAVQQRLHLVSQTDKTCRFHSLPPHPRLWGRAIAVQRNSGYYDRVTVAMLHLLSHGVVKAIDVKYTHPIMYTLLPTKSVSFATKSEKLNNGVLETIWIAYGMVICVAIAVLVVEKACYKIQHFI